MKNLNKKISAVALASMVVLGGVVASGAKSFAWGAEEGIEQINKKIKEFNGKNYQVEEFYGSRESAELAAKELYGHLFGYNRIFQERSLKGLVKSGNFDVFILKRNDSRFYIVIKEGYAKQQIKAEVFE